MVDSAAADSVGHAPLFGAVGCDSAQAMREAGAAFALRLTGGRVSPPPVILSGPLGAGKTEFVRGVARALDVDPREVASPTFPIVHEYRGGKAPLLHFDFYRLAREDEVWGIGWEEYTGTGLIFVEWGEKFPGVFPSDALQVRITPSDDGTRNLETRPFFPFGGLSANLP